LHYFPAMTRPASVPASASWSAAQKAWIVGDPQQDGLVRYYRADGSPWCEYTYAGGTLNGPFRRFHENGEVASQGDMAGGRFVGTNVVRRSRSASSEVFPEHFGPQVWRFETDYDASGKASAQRMYDAVGRELSAEELMLGLLRATSHVADALKSY
jgi:hypothetical protein